MSTAPEREEDDKVVGAVSVEGEVGFEGGNDVVLRRSAGSYPERGSSATNVTRTLVRKCRGPSGGSKLTKFSNTKSRAAREVAPFSQCHWRQDRSPTAGGGNMGHSGRDGHI